MLVSVRLSTVVAAAVALFGTSALAQDTQDQARGFVEQVALSSSRDAALARWEGAVCVGAVGMAPAEAQALVDRISARAQAVGLHTGAPGCRANVMVIYAPDSDTLSRQIVDQRRDLLGFSVDDGRVTAGRDAMEDFARTQRPIRWWHVSSSGVGSVRPDAARSRQSSGATAAAAAAGGSATVSDMGSTQDLEGVDAVRVNGSRARPEVRNELTYALIVVDARRVANVPAGAWMDYVAFNALTQVDPDGRTADFPTILNLFSQAQGAPTALTAWDTSYLSALYRARNEGSSRQISSISRRMSEGSH
ncbi:MAG: hypothetical protein NT015_02930 [Alphaproteobacteria bacterium]|nr:hypothetical protein [Alphaproteobacteria bacterium]